ncbi:uncharacterized protein LOC111297736 [Durio zibethinus]|uniref:Uncharacterized protein LOC111297736 n=1 Tax=Durio zibethinus TaxID=66656 RepID=A0A6P5Z5V8_DURZI|nr:uncharacterized protein LOC111297736 [Durio zibethinus]
MGKITDLLVYVDDIIVTRNDTIEQDLLQRYLSQEFEIKELGRLKYFLGIEVACSKDGIFLSQRKYVLDLLKHTRKLSKVASTPIDQNHRIGANKRGDDVNKGGYQGLVEGLYLEKEVIKFSLEASTDADYASFVVDKRSTSGYFCFLGGNLGSICLAENDFHIFKYLLERKLIDQWKMTY